MEIRQLDKEVYAGKKFTAQYQTNGYYDIRATGQGFEIKYTPFEAPTEKGFDDVFFGEWLEDPVAFGAFEDGKLAGFVEGAPESWNNRFRISNICVFDNAQRSKGVGTDEHHSESGGSHRRADDRSGDSDLQRKRRCILQKERI